jgi:hypothetical protein
MTSFPFPTTSRRLAVLAFLFFAAVPLLAAPTGPTLNFDYGNGRPMENALYKFMYFVPLVSPEQVSVSTNAGNTQAARVLACHCQTNGATFHALCEFEFVGDGWQRNDFDHANSIKRHDKELKAGKTIPHQLDAIIVQGGGSGSIEIEGRLTNGQPVVTGLEMHFNNHGHVSPVTITLHDMSLTNGVLRLENETIARVNSLGFRLKAGVPKMEISLASVKAKSAGDGLWHNMVGRIKGIVANLFIPPITVTTDGHQAMMDFGLALATHQAAYTFPLATRLRDQPATTH